MKYAVIRTGGKQYRVSEGDVVKIEKLDAEVGEKITLADVLFVGDDGDVKIGTPLVPNAKVTGEIVEQGAPRRSSFSRRNGAKATAGSRATGNTKRL